MSVLVLDEVRPVARKDHTCEVCWGTIGKGDRYLRQRNVGDDGAYTFKAHGLCWAAWCKAHRDGEMYDDEAPDNQDEVVPLVRSFFAAFAGVPADQIPEGWQEVPT